MIHLCEPIDSTLLLAEKARNVNNYEAKISIFVEGNEG